VCCANFARKPGSSCASRITRRYSAAGISQPRKTDGSPAGSHPSFRPHLMQGWSPDFIPKLTEDAVALKLIDRIVPVNGRRALELARELARKEGIFAGISGGATLAAALQVCDEAPPGATVLCMLPDTGERYLSTPLFSDIPAEMTDEELAIARSTPNYRFDVAPPPPPGGTLQPSSPDAEEFVARLVGDREQPVVMFASNGASFAGQFERCSRGTASVIARLIWTRSSIRKTIAAEESARR